MKPENKQYEYVIYLRLYQTTRPHKLVCPRWSGILEIAVTITCSVLNWLWTNRLTIYSCGPKHHSPVCNIGYRMTCKNLPHGSLHVTRWHDLLWRRLAGRHLPPPILRGTPCRWCPLPDSPPAAGMCEHLWNDGYVRTIAWLFSVSRVSGCINEK